MTRATQTSVPRSEFTPAAAAPPVPAAGGTLPDDPAPPIAREGWPIVGAFVLGSVLLSAGASWLLGTAGLIGVGAVCAAVCLWCLWFFRDPARRTPSDQTLVISPADGVVVLVGPAAPPPELKADGLAPEMPRVCVFMNVFNVHVNRSPVGGTVVGAHYRPGKFFNASLDKASVDNERSSLAIRTGTGQVLAVVQIAGLIARRIVSKVKVGDTRRAGERYGLIRFGSRVDVYLPIGSEIVAKVGEVTVAGETVIARLPAPPAA